MLDGDSNGDILIPVAKTKCTDWVPSRMDQQTADTYWNIVKGTENSFGCIGRINGGCLVGYWEVVRYIEVEGYKQSSIDGYWYANALQSELADDLFRMLDGSRSNDINLRFANQKCTNWVPYRMNSQTAEMYREIVNGTKSQFGCYRMEFGGDCVVVYWDVVRYIESANYTKRPENGEWYRQ